MLSPFPGMDPYLETHWHAVRHLLLTSIRDELNKSLPIDQMYAQIAHADSILEIKDQLMTAIGSSSVDDCVLVSQLSEDKKSIAVIQVLDMVHKTEGFARVSYREQQRLIWENGISLIEIDLLREGNPIIRLKRLSHKSSYHVCVHRGWWHELQIVYRIPIDKRIPKIEIPLRKTDRKLHLDLQLILHRCYTIGNYDSRINYKIEPDPPLREEEARWADGLLREKGLR